MRAAALALAVLGCGLAPQDEFTGRRAGDGIAPWQEEGAVEMCLEATRLGPVALPAAGLCVPAGADRGDACEANRDCRSRESCVCGRCTALRCDSSDDCPAGRQCRDQRCQVVCEEDRDCATGEVCAASVCRQTCATTDECQGGEVCATEGLERRCTAVLCADASECRADEECRIQRDPHAIDEPTVLWDDGVVMWLEIDGAIWRAESPDGRSFRLDPEEPVVADARAPSVVRTGGGYELWAETVDGLATATSPDGRTFGPLQTAFMGDLHAPAAARHPDGWTLLYAESGGDVIVAGVGPALSGAEVSDELFWRDVTAVGSPFVLLEGGLVRLWFSGHGIESAATEELGELALPPPNDSIGYASTVVGAEMTFQPWPFNPVFQRTIAFLTKQEEGAPAVVRVGDRDEYLLYFVGEDGLRLARNPPALP